MTFFHEELHPERQDAMSVELSLPTPTQYALLKALTVDGAIVRATGAVLHPNVRRDGTYKLKRQIPKGTIAAALRRGWIEPIDDPTYATYRITAEGERARARSFAADMVTWSKT